MRKSGNTLLVTGGGSGIGRRLAEEFHARGNKVIIAGRNLAKLEEVAGGHAGMAAMALDVDAPADIVRFARELTSAHPNLNVLVNNAGIMRTETFGRQDLADAEAIVTTNLLGPIRLTAALLPHLLRQPQAGIVNVSSGLAFVPLVSTPTYSATKAALHSYTVSLRRQMQGTAVEVTELIPPGVQTDLVPGQATDPSMMPLEEFIAETMALFDTRPTPSEIRVNRVDFLRLAETEGRFDAALDILNPVAGPLERNVIP